MGVFHVHYTANPRFKNPEQTQIVLDSQRVMVKGYAIYRRKVLQVSEISKYNVPGASMDVICIQHNHNSKLSQAGVYVYVYIPFLGMKLSL